MNRNLYGVAQRSLIGVAFISSFLISSPTWAQVSVQDPWVRATVPQQTSSGAYMQITSARPARLLGVHSPVAATVEIHEMKMDGDVMHMHAVTGIDLPAGKAVELKPGGYHVMLQDLKQALKPGTSVPLTLEVEGADKKRQVIEVKAAVRATAVAH